MMSTNAMSETNSNFTVITEHFVNVTITSNIFSAYECGKRFSKDLTIFILKGKLEVMTGASTATMKLIVFDDGNNMICQLDDNNALLGSYPVNSGMRIHVEDKQHRASDFDDVSKVEKFEISEEEYSRRSDSLRSFKEKNKLGQFNEVQQVKELNQQTLEDKRSDAMKIGDRHLVYCTTNEDDDAHNEANSMYMTNKMQMAYANQFINKINDTFPRCDVRLPNQPFRRGVVKYIGNTDFKSGVWIGVQYDEPFGKNDGSVGGKRYFQCQPKYGGFVKPSAIEVGDFPELCIDDDEM